MMGNRGNAEHFPGGVDPFLERRAKDEKRGSARLREMVSWVVKGSTFTCPVHPRLISSLFRESPRPASFPAMI